MMEPVISMLRSRTTQLLLVTLVVSLAAGCSDSPLSTSSDAEGPMLAIADGGHPSSEVFANPDVFFLEPLADFDPTNPNFDGMPNPNLVPTARICQLGVGDGEGVPKPTGRPGTVFPCVAFIADLAMTYDMTGGFYRVNLKDAGALSPDYHHRIEIFLANQALGALRDLDVDDGPATASCTDEDFCRVNRDGQGRVGVPIKVIIENNAACLALDPTFDPEVDFCVTATLDGGQSLVAEKNGEPLAAATPNEGATISIRSCTDLRARGNGISDHVLGRIDLVTWGDCVEIDALDLTSVTGVAELCDAPGLALASGFSEDQVDRLTIHEHSAEDFDNFAFALGHAEGNVCEAPAPAQGQAYQFTKMQQFVRAVRGTWRTVSTHVSELLQPSTLNACNRGCSSSGTFRTSYQVAGPAWWVFDPSNLDGDLGTHDQGTVLTARAKVFDSGEFHDGVTPPLPEAYEGLRVTVTVNGVTQTEPIYSDENGIVEFSFSVQGGVNTVKFEAIGVGGEDGDGNPVNNVFAPSMQSTTAAPVQLAVGELVFTAIGKVPFEFTVQPVDVLMEDATNTLATLSTVQVCTVGGALEGIAVDEIIAVNNNGSWVNLTIADGSTFEQNMTDVNGCITFDGLSALQVNKTGAYRLIVNPVFDSRGKASGGDDQSVKFNVRPFK